MQLGFNFLWISCLNKQWNANICGQMFVFWTQRLHLMSVVCSRTLWMLLIGIHPVRTGLSVMSAISSLLRLCLFTSTLGLNWLRGLCCVMTCSFFWARWSDWELLSSVQLTSTVVIATVSNQSKPHRLNINHSKHLGKVEMVRSGAKFALCGKIPAKPPPGLNLQPGEISGWAFEANWCTDQLCSAKWTYSGLGVNNKAELYMC